LTTPSLKQLEALQWVAQLGSFQAAATRLHTTQSAISKRIAELESLFGRPLFDRTRRTAQLTPEGQRLAAGAQELLALSNKLMADMAEPEQYEGVFRLGATELIGVTWLATFVRRVQLEYPLLLLELDVDHGGRLLEKLNQGRFDMALVPGPMWGRIFEGVPLRTLDRCWMASPSLGVPRRVLTVEELSAFPIASQYPDTIHARLQSAWFHHSGAAMQHAVQANSFAVVGEMVLAGLGIGQLPVQYYAEALRQGRLVKLRTTPVLPNVRYFAVHRRTPAHRLAAPLAKLARAECDFGARA
jgi:DNA-binding transcriptional LysR family regulator